VPALGSIMLINAPLEAVFDLAQDYNLRLKWDPALKEAQFLDGATEVALGARVRLRARAGITMTVEYFGVRRPFVVAAKMVRGPRVFRQFVSNWHFRSVDAETTEVTFKCVFETRWLWMSKRIDPLLFSMISRDNRKRLAGLKRGVEELGLIDRPGGRPS